MSEPGGKASWDYNSTKVFIDQCIDQIYKKQRRGTSSKREAWDHIQKAFNDITKRGYSKKQLKNRYNCLRKEWRNWEALLAKAIGVGFDPVKNMILADDKWWARRIRENPQLAPFQHTGCRYANELQIIFKDVLASGDHALAPSATPVEDKGIDVDVVYRPQMEDQDDDRTEGFGDSEEADFGAAPAPSLGVTADLNGMIVQTNNIATGSTGCRKRKIGEKSALSKRSKKFTSQVVVDCMSRIAAASEGRAAVLDREQRRETPLLIEVIPELLHIEAIACDPDFCLRCVNIMMHSMCRDMYAVLKGSEEDLLDWLQEHAYNAPHLQRPPKS